MRLVTIVIAVAWIAVVAWFGWTALPHLPLDVSSNDPDTLDALNVARARHAAVFSVIGLVPAIIVIWLGRWLSR